MLRIAPIAFAAAALLVTANAAYAAGDAAAGEKTYKLRCNFCHSPTADTAGKQGPALAGVVDRKAGTLAGYAYSDAMKTSGLTWDEATLKSYIPATSKIVPGGKMLAVTGMTDAQLDDVVAYLHTLK